MKINKRILFVIVLAAGMVSSLVLKAQEETEKGTLNLELRYFCENNSVPYLLIRAKTKIEKKFQPVKGIGVKLYLGDVVNEQNFIGNYVTTDKGLAKAVLPVGLQQAWKALPKQSFFAIAAATDRFDEAESTIEINKSRISIDTVSDGETRSVAVTVTQLMDSVWVPVPEVEVKIGIVRMSGALPIGESESYTTDSLGKISAEFTVTEVPGDINGHVTIKARIDDHETMGNIAAAVITPWGKPTVNDANFFKRALWGSRSNAPLWLIGFSNLAIVLVWGVMIYVVFQLFKLKKF